MDNITYNVRIWNTSGKSEGGNSTGGRALRHNPGY